MKEYELSNRGIERERDGSAERAVAPAYVRLMISSSVFGYRESEYRNLEEISRVRARSSRARFCVCSGLNRCYLRVQLERFVRFMIRQKSDRSLTVKFD